MDELGIDKSNISFWNNYFSKNCDLNASYFTTSDNSKLLVVESFPIKTTSNKTIVLIPGWFSDILGWKDVTLFLSKTNHIIYFESREKVSSFPISMHADFSVKRLSLDLKEMLIAYNVNLSNSIFVGSSMGSTTILQYLVDNTKYNWNMLPFHSVVIGPNAEFKGPAIITSLILSLPIFFFKFTLGFVRWYVLKFKIDAKSDPDQAEKYKRVLSAAKPWKVRQSGRAVMKYQIWDDLHYIDAKLTIIGAETDKMHSAEISTKLQNLIKNCNYNEFKTNKDVHSKIMGEYLLQLSKN